MSKKTKIKNIEKLKQDLLQAYKKQLDEIYTEDSFELTFDERENLITNKMDHLSCEILEKHIEKDPEGVSRKNPQETRLCHCETCAILCRDEQGNIKMFDREIKTKNGPVKVKEYGYYCSKCRKVFFPSAQKT